MTKYVSLNTQYCLYTLDNMLIFHIWNITCYIFHDFIFSTHHWYLPLLIHVHLVHSFQYSTEWVCVCVYHYLPTLPSIGLDKCSFHSRIHQTSLRVYLCHTRYRRWRPKKKVCNSGIRAKGKALPYGDAKVGGIPFTVPAVSCIVMTRAQEGEKA